MVKILYEIEKVNSKVIPKFETTSWLRDIFDGTNGIWLGGNASTQSAIRMPELNLNDKRTSFPQIGYVVNDTSHTIIKYIVDKECNTEDEE